MQLINCLQKNNYKYFQAIQSYKHKMIFLRELQGMDVSDYQAIQLNKSAFAEVDIHLYPPFRTHFIIHAIQFQHEVPSQTSMLRTERRNAKKAIKKEDDKQRLFRPMMPLTRLARPFMLPAKKGLPVQKLRRKRVHRNANLRRAPISMMHPLPSSINRPLGNPLSATYSMPMFLGLPFVTQLIKDPQTGLTIPASIPGMGMMMGPHPMLMNPIPPNGPFLPSSMPSSMSSSMPPMMPPMMPSMMPTIKAHILPMQMHVPIASNKRKKGKASKQLSTPFKIKSSQQIVLKAARDACKEKLENWRKEAKPNISDKLQQEVPIYFQKKKANQKRRRLEKHELIKKNVKQLVNIYGDAVFNSGWPISRREIKEALGIKDQQNEIDLDGVFEMMKEQQTAEEKIEQNIICQAQIQIDDTKKEIEKKKLESEVKLVLIKPKEEVSVQLVPQLVFTS